MVRPGFLGNRQGWSGRLVTLMPLALVVYNRRAATAPPAPNPMSRESSSLRLCWDGKVARRRLLEGRIWTKEPADCTGGERGLRTRDRSEERRVGKEGRSRWSPHH